MVTRGCILGAGALLLLIFGQQSFGQQEYRLLNNYPNPFNPSTVVRYQLPAASDVSLTIHDMLGRHVATLANGKREAGVHEVTFDASGLPTGMYLCRLRAGSYTGTLKLILAR
jgi:glucuronoarabinoxylan endo-1,4-beta-xylanase